MHCPTVVSSSRWLACFCCGHMLPVQQIQSKSSPIPGENSLVCVCALNTAWRDCFICVLVKKNHYYSIGVHSNIYSFRRYFYAKWLKGVIHSKWTLVVIYSRSCVLNMYDFLFSSEDGILMNIGIQTTSDPTDLHYMNKTIFQNVFHRRSEWLILGWTIPLKTRNSMSDLIEKLEVHTLRAVACWQFPWDYCNTVVEYLWLYCTIVYSSLPVSLHNGPPVERLCTACIKTMKCRLAWNLLCFKILVQFSKSLDLGYPE